MLRHIAETFALTSLLLSVTQPAMAGVDLTGRSAAGRILRLSFAEDKVTRASRVAVLCSEPRAALAEAELWMPEHGHGSSPTRLNARADGCTSVEQLQFVMKGAWQVRLRFADNDRGIINVTVQD